MSENKYPQKPGTGTLFEPRNKRDNGPDYTGFVQLQSGEIVGLAIWKKSTRGGELLSVQISDRETEFQAKRLGLPAYKAGAQQSQTQQRGGDDRRESFGRDMSDRERAGFGRGDDAEEPRGFMSRARDADDFDDDIPF